MSFSLSHGRQMDTGRLGVAQDELPPVDAGRLDLRSWFGPPGGVEYQRPLELEIGSGKGTFLLSQAAAMPGVNYIGLEWARQFWLYAADRCRRHGLGNVRVVRADAGAFVRSYVPDACLRQVHVYFPDPWPKARHHKRRIVQAEFLHELWRVLEAPAAPAAGIPRSGEAGSGAGAPAGCLVQAPNPNPQAPPQIRLATDHADYFAWMEEHAARVADLFERLPFESPASAGEGELVGTNFERKYRREGRPFYAMILRKKGDRTGGA